MTFEGILFNPLHQGKVVRTESLLTYSIVCDLINLMMYARIIELCNITLAQKNTFFGVACPQDFIELKSHTIF